MNTLVLEPQTAPAGPPNKPPTKVALASDFPDEIQELGDRIASLSIKQSVELAHYMKEHHGWDGLPV